MKYTSQWRLSGWSPTPQSERAKTQVTTVSSSNRPTKKRLKRPPEKGMACCMLRHSSDDQPPTPLPPPPFPSAVPFPWSKTPAESGPPATRVSFERSPRSAAVETHRKGVVRVWRPQGGGREAWSLVNIFELRSHRPILKATAIQACHNVDFVFFPELYCNNVLEVCESEWV